MIKREDQNTYMRKMKKSIIMENINIKNKEYWQPYKDYKMIAGKKQNE